SQLGTDSEPDRRMNINYRNVDDNMNVVPGMETNLFTWTPIQFFTNAADRLLRAQFPDGSISITNIPVFATNRLVYSPVVHRLLQLAANMYEATVLTNANYPSMFQPYFGMHSNQVVIKGYRPVVLPTLQQLTNTPPFPIDLNEFN